MFSEKKNDDKESAAEAQIENSENDKDEKGVFKIKKDVLVSTLVEKYPQLVEPLMMMGMHCISCFASQMETLEEAAMVHGLNPDEVVEDLNQFLADSNGGEKTENSESMFY